MASSKTGIDVHQLANDLTLISNKYNGANILANTFLKLGKPTSENLLPYRRHNGKNNLLKIFISFLFFFPHLFAHVTREIVRAIYFRKENSLAINELIPSGFLFVSHYTHSTMDYSKDSYFGAIPYELNSTTSKSSVLLLNHTKEEAKLIFQEFEKNSCIPHYVNPKAFGTRELVLAIRNQLPTSLRMIWGAIVDRKINSRQRLLLLDASINQFSRSTFAAIILVKNLERVLLSVQPRNVVLTFEGHSFEVLALKLIHDRFPRVRVLLYQYAPIVKDQFGIVGTLRTLSPSDTVLVTGASVKDYFKRSVLSLENQIEILGSPKQQGRNIEGFTEFNMGDRLSVCLFAPEASKEAFDELLQIAITCSKAMTSRRFIIRTHPASDFDQNAISIIEGSFSSNLILSRNSLVEDLQLSGFCVYRSSAVAIQGLAEGVRPIHFSSTNGDGLDPLAITALKHETITKASQLISYLKSIDEGGKSTLIPSLAEMRKAYDDYFQPLNPQILKDF